MFVTETHNYVGTINDLLELIPLHDYLTHSKRDPLSVEKFCFGE